jgi:hypothetical protein
MKLVSTTSTPGDVYQYFDSEHHQIQPDLKASGGVNAWVAPTGSTIRSFESVPASSTNPLIPSGATYKNDIKFIMQFNEANIAPAFFDEDYVQISSPLLPTNDTTPWEEPTGWTISKFEPVGTGTNQFNLTTQTDLYVERANVKFVATLNKDTGSGTTHKYFGSDYRELPSLLTDGGSTFTPAGQITDFVAKTTSQTASPAPLYYGDDVAFEATVATSTGTTYDYFNAAKVRQPSLLKSTVGDSLVDWTAPEGKRINEYKAVSSADRASIPSTIPTNDVAYVMKLVNTIGAGGNVNQYFDSAHHQIAPLALKGQSGFGQTLEVCKSIYNSEGYKGFYRGAVQPFYDMLRILLTFAAAAWNCILMSLCRHSRVALVQRTEPGAGVGVV